MTSERPPGDASVGRVVRQTDWAECSLRIRRVSPADRLALERETGTVRHTTNHGEGWSSV